MTTHSAAVDAGRRGPRWGPLVGWVGLVAAFLLLMGINESRWVWATAAGTGFSGTDIAGNDAIPLAVLQLTIVLTFAGAAVAAAVGIAAVPGTRRSRWAVTGLLLLWPVWTAVSFVTGYREEVAAGRPIDPVVQSVGAVAIGLVPLLVVLPLVWRARRGAAVVAGGAALLAAAAHVVSVFLLVVYPPEVELGTWLTLVAVAVGAAAGLWLVRVTPRGVRPPAG